MTSASLQSNTTRSSVDAGRFVCLVSLLMIFQSYNYVTAHRCAYIVQNMKATLRYPKNKNKRKGISSKISKYANCAISTLQTIEDLQNTLQNPSSSRKRKVFSYMYRKSYFKICSCEGFYKNRRIIIIVCIIF